MKIRKNCALAKLQLKNQGVESECSKCKRILPMTVDHIIPVNLLEQLGLYEECLEDEENFELLCRYCNAYKGGRIDLVNPKTVVLLKKYINKL